MTKSGKKIVAKGEIACFEQFHLLSLCFQKAICCRGVRKRLSMFQKLQMHGHEAKGKGQFCMLLQETTFEHEHLKRMPLLN